MILLLSLCRMYPVEKSARRSKLRELQEREAAKARMARLQTMLQQKLVQKYGSVRFGITSACVVVYRSYDKIITPSELT